MIVNFIEFERNLNMKFSVVGVGSFTSKKKNTTYDVIHAVSMETSRMQGFQGDEVDKFFVDRAFGILVRTPCVGDVIEVFYNRSGYVDRIDII